MCLPGQPPAPPASAGEALSAIRAGLGYLTTADAASLTTAEQADCLRALEQATSMHTAARSKILTAFHAQDGCADDGHGSTRTWLRWQTRVSGGAAAGAIGWMRRLSTHPVVADALAAAGVSESWARHICDWTDKLPPEHRDDADQILLAAAASGSELRDLSRLAEEIHKRTARPDTDDGNDGFADRSLHLARTFRGAGKLHGDLTAQCAAALAAVLEALGKRAGPEDLRSKCQRDHDALEEAMRRLIAAGCLPERAGQPTQIQLLMTLDQLRGLDGAGAAEAAWAAAAGPGYDCDATIVPVVTGHIDNAALDQLTASLLAGHNPATAWHNTAGRDRQDSQATRDAEADAARRQLADQALRQILIDRAADLLSGPTGLAAYLRTGLLDGPAASVSLPLDTGAATETIPAHLRRLVITRDRHCRFPGCDQPPAGCQPHHIIPRSQGGPTSLTNLLLLCTFHHLIAVHRWGWGIVLMPDGTVTATSPIDGRTLRSHGPPSQAA
jgi:Domain of unknown function (DUF222)/HNH endonuclease